ncbi:hypothetical protein HXW87_20785 [Pseudomonas sp. Y5-11]|jgi:hypothetical protein|uniref:hypothetical protein n=1 Tax=Pseudomonas sp. Y5-11 TaxID=2749808 RepID=UPI001EFACCD5|nr:hypothetical protein [Pseudomonas sp. Y5-11]ULN84516.1 hypothetical protein HXW87_20785 [Pseudomonas sp. Y5-11]
MSNKIWYLPGPFHQYREDVKALAKEHGLRIIDASITENRDGEADDVPEVTVRQVEPAPVLLIADSGDHAALQELIDKLNAERDGIVLLIDAAEGLSDLEHPGAGELPIRLFGALKAIHEGFEALTGERDNLAGEVESLRAEVERLKAAAEPVDNAEKIANLKAQLDAANVTYRANASVESLEKAVAELQQA